MQPKRNAVSGKAIVCLLSILTFGLAASAADATFYDLKADWSDTYNPNGVWSYYVNNNTLGGSMTTAGMDPWLVTQKAWGVSAPNVWFKSNGSENFAHDWQAGDVITHTGTSSIVWTSPGAGTVSVSGDVWHTRDLGRSNSWTIYLNGSVLTGGNVVDGGPDSRSNPISFASGSGGPGVLTSVAVNSGDTLKLTLVQTTAYGDYVGVNMAVDFTPVPLPAAMLLLGPALGCLALVRRRPRR